MTEVQRFIDLYKSLEMDNKLIHVGLLLERAVKLWPHNTAVICQDVSITYQELYKRSCLMAEQLKQLGVKPLDKVIIFWENSIEFYIAYFGVWHAGASVAPLNVFLHENELAHIIKDASPAVLIISQQQIHKLTQLPQAQLPPLITNIDKSGILPETISSTIVDRDIDEIAALLYTSGTTGFPKGVMLTSRNIIINAIQGIARFDLSTQDRVYSALPLFHSLPQNTCIWASVIAGVTAIIIPKIDRKHLLNGFKYKPTLVMAVPALYGIFCMMKTINFGAVRYFFSGGDALSNKIRSFFELIYRRKICNGYGLTETSPFISVDIDDFTQQTNTVGRPFIGISYSLRDDLGKEITDGIGVLWVKGDNIMKGYYNAPDATKLILKDGWLNTGDLAYIDKNNKIVLAGRQRELIVNKGLKIYPQEIENLLLSNSDVQQAAVVGFKQNDEEIPIAFVASKNTNSEALISSLKQLCQRNLAYYKVPRRFIIRKELPVTQTGKVDKKKLIAELTGSLMKD